jgi:hypothetical protein
LDFFGRSFLGDVTYLKILETRGDFEEFLDFVTFDTDFLIFEVDGVYEILEVL